MDRPLPAPVTPFHTVGGEQFFTDYFFVPSGVFQLLVMSITGTAFLWFFTADGAGTFAVELAPLKLYTFDIPPSVVGYNVEAPDGVYIYLPGAAYY